MGNIKVIKGTVIRGTGDGKKIGFPTANINPESDISDLKHGVYACDVLVVGKKYKGVAHFGPRAVFGEINPQFEVHILDFDLEIYGKIVDVYLNKYLRKTKNFNSVEELRKQISIDIERI